jgi:hypothetical protein
MTEIEKASRAGRPQQLPLSLRQAARQRRRYPRIGDFVPWRVGYTGTGARDPLDAGVLASDDGRMLNRRH